jgi:hypothetical protein
MDLSLSVDHPATIRVEEEDVIVAGISHRTIGQDFPHLSGTT